MRVRLPPSAEKGGVDCLRVFYVHEDRLPSDNPLGGHVYGVGLHLSKLGCEVCLILMYGSWAVENLHSFYFGREPLTPIRNLKLWPVFSLSPFARLIGIRTSWPMLRLTRSVVDFTQPNVLLFSEWKTARFFLQYRNPHIKYVQEILNLPFYLSSNKEDKKRVSLNEQKTILEFKNTLHATDLVIVPTEELLKQLQSPPYFMRDITIRVLPLASSENRLPKKCDTNDKLIKLFYVGNLEEWNGLDDLAVAMEDLLDIELHIVTQDKKRLSSLKSAMGSILGSHRFFIHNLSNFKKKRELVCEADAFVSPFRNHSPCVYEGHPSLPDYMAWCRPILAPNFPVVRQLLPKGPWEGLLYQHGSIESMRDKLKLFQNPTYRFMISESLYDFHLERCSEQCRIRQMKRLIETCR
ncbi:glycosyltransferase [Candidatus Similichlamydia epinepheli]|uniref:glycosyltransferase n=1 Tax=Candidatus Similichlamydia epinepheli TaxID=1903953 RepID=UPI000D37DE82|nr:glycosyltransferase [Candidatus Similichlamydia epinepheli]